MDPFRDLAAVESIFVLKVEIGLVRVSQNTKRCRGMEKRPASVKVATPVFKHHAVHNMRLQDLEAV